MVIITKIYEENDQTRQMVSSFQNQGFEVAVISGKHKGNGETLRELYECYKRASGGHETFCYSDGGDTYCQRPFEVPKDSILYSTEKALYPETAPKYPHNPKAGKWKYLNGGGYCGSLALMIEFMEKYGLTKHPGDANGQLEQHIAYLAAKADKFPIKLDTKCEIFQTTAFADEGELELEDGLVVNKITGSTPAIIHANGITRTPKEWPFKLWW